MNIAKIHFCLVFIYAECVSNVDETLGEMFLEEKTPTEDDIRVGCDTLSFCHYFCSVQFDLHLTLSTL